MKYYLIAPLKLNLPPLEYESHETFHKNDIVKISVKNKTLLGIVLSEVEKPNFKCKEAVRSEFALSESQVILGHFVANYYCTNLSVAFGIFTLGNSPLELHSVRLLGFGASQTPSLVSAPKIPKNYESQTENPSVVDSAHSAESSEKNKSKKHIKSFCYFWLSPKVESPLPLNTNLPNNAPKRELSAQSTFTPPTLSFKQQSALDFILSHDKTLLFGDTGSGKTEIYINAICETLKQGKNTLFLMPEIALTPQMERRLKSVFGDLVCIWHSKVSKVKKERILTNLHSIKIIAGARSALFLPLENLGLIIIDEEHDEAYKSTTNPRYNSRDLAIFLAQKQGIRIILGSATPSLNSYYNFAKENRIFRLKGGYFEGKKSIVFDSDLENIPQSLLEKIATALKNQKQIIVFVPMRGNFKVLQCESCGSGVKCKHCSINMSLHAKKNALICHYCGYAEPFFDGRTKCKFCDSTAFKALKIGTQEVYKNLSAHFTNAKIAIFDRDEVKSDSRLRGILGDFNDGKIDILIGTQMISKGHDYHNVELVAILGIDNLLNSSDFRAYERAVALLFQIAGRCGRKNDGEVFINTQNRAFFMRFLSDYEDFLRFELENRANLYPPFVRLALICAQNKSEVKAKEILQNAKKIVESTRRNIEIIGLNKAPIERIGGLWRYFMLIRAKSAKELLTALVPIKDMGLIIDIDPQSIF